MENATLPPSRRSLNLMRAINLHSILQLSRRISELNSLDSQRTVIKFMTCAALSRRPFQPAQSPNPCRARGSADWRLSLQFRHGGCQNGLRNDTANKQK